MEQKQTRKLYLGIAVAILVIVLLFFLVKPAKSEEKIKIGLMAPFSGYAASFGGMIQNGLDMALAELPAETRDRIEIIKEDDVCGAKSALTAAQKLINVDGVKYVLGPMCNEAILASESLFEDNKVISLTLGLPSNKIANMGNYHFSFSPEIRYMVGAIAEKIKEDKITKVAVIYISAPFETENHDYFVKYLTENGGVVVADESIVRGSTDFRTAVQKVKESNPEAIMIAAHSAELISILKEIKELGIDNLPKYGIHAAESPVILKEAASIAEGLIYPYPADKIEIPSAKAFRDAYTSKYGLGVDPYSSNAYDNLKILVSAINECGADNSECILDKLSTLKDYSGANGLLSVDERGVGNYKEVMLKVIRSGKFEKLG